MVIERANNQADYVLMYINPQRITIRYRKVIQQVQTNTRWVFQHWGAEPVTISYNGVTGYMNSVKAQEYIQKWHPESFKDFYNGKSGMKRISTYETPAYLALLKLKTFYEEPHRWLQGRDLTKLSGELTDARLQDLKLNLYYRDTIYTGYFIRMEIQEEEMSPWMWSYSMEFTAYETQSNPFARQWVRWERDDLRKAAIEAGVRSDALLARASGLTETAPKVKGLLTPGEARGGPAATAVKSYKRGSYTDTPELRTNLIQRTIMTTESDE
jgi:hypothetical protein